MAGKKSEKIPFLTKRKSKKGNRNVSVIQEEPRSMGNNRENNRETGLSDDMNDLSEEVITLKANGSPRTTRPSVRGVIDHITILDFEITILFRPI